MHSIYHFFKDLVLKKDLFTQIAKLENFPFDTHLLACQNAGQFPDLAIRLCAPNDLFTGGELIELKDSDNYKVSSFNSTIPTGKKSIEKIIKSENSSIKHQMEQVGDDIFSLEEREVFYLIRGKHKKRSSQKIALIHGSFFETIQSNDLISQSFSQVLNERLLESGLTMTPEIKDLLTTMFSEQANFSKVRIVPKASVKLRFRVMTEVKAEGNILNDKKYPEILDNTLNLVLPYHQEGDRIHSLQKMAAVFTASELSAFEEIKLKHHFNGYFTVFQVRLS
jgi:hypothetical protein